jgi:hypothetical protein
VSTLQTNRYAQWRVERGAVTSLHDDDDSPPERLLQAIWQHQRLRRDRLTTLDGQALRVLHPGFINTGSGPDFLGAVIQFGGDILLTGDVEVDVRTSGWHSHGHDRNPAFRKVILHVVWDRDARGAPAPRSACTEGAEFRTVSIRDVLDTSLAELSQWLECDSPRTLPELFLGKCSPSMRGLTDEQVNDLLREAAQVRFCGRAAQVRARARHVGWEQVLWEALFRALGYSQNAWPMFCLAETRQEWMREAPDTLTLQARLLGLSGLLPSELERQRAGGDEYLRRMWNSWWRERSEFEHCLLPRKVWRFHRLRPANHPQRRLALASHWLVAGDMPAKIQRWCAAPCDDAALVNSLLAVLRVERDDFWSWHWTLRSGRLPQPRPLLGANRVTDLALNAILPWLFARSTEGNNRRICSEVERRFLAWPAGQDNAVLRLARQRVLGGRPMKSLSGAAAQQGIIQITRDFCGHTNALCDDCEFPGLVKRTLPKP